MGEAVPCDSLGDMNKCLLKPGEAFTTKQRNHDCQDQLGEPLSSSYWACYDSIDEGLWGSKGLKESLVKGLRHNRWSLRKYVFMELLHNSSTRKSAVPSHCLIVFITMGRDFLSLIPFMSFLSLVSSLFSRVFTQRERFKSEETFISQVEIVVKHESIFWHLLIFT